MNFLSNLIDGLAFAYILAVVPVPLFWLVFHGGIGFWRRWGTRSYWVALPVWVSTGVALWQLRPWMFAEAFPPQRLHRGRGPCLMRRRSLDHEERGAGDGIPEADRDARDCAREAPDGAGHRRHLRSPATSAVYGIGAHAFRAQSAERRLGRGGDGGAYGGSVWG